MTELALANRHPCWRLRLPALRRLLRVILRDPVFLLPPPGPRGQAATNSAASTAALRHQLAVFFVDAPAMAGVNETHLGHDGPTDVITFDYGRPPGAGRDEAWLCGDLFVCLDVARTQAADFGTTWPAEVLRYVIHGLLHLRGYDDRAAVDRRAMKVQENRLLRGLLRGHPADAAGLLVPRARRAARRSRRGPTGRAG